MKMPSWPEYGSDITWLNRLEPEYFGLYREWLRAKRPVFGSRQGEGTPIFTKTTFHFRPIHRRLNLKSAPLSHAARQLNDEVKNSFLSSSRVDISGVLWNNQQMQLYAVNFIPLLGSLYMFRVFHTPIIRSTIYNCIYSHWYKSYYKVQRQCYKISW